LEAVSGKICGKDAMRMRKIDPIWLEKRMLDKSADLITKFWQFLCEHPDFFKDDANDILVFAPEDDPVFTAADLKRAVDEARERENWGVMIIEVTQDGTAPCFSIARRISPEEVAQSTVEELLVTA
jgi:hypothetical protein